MALLKAQRTTPPDGFVYVQPETGVRIERDTLGELEDSVIAHRQYKGIEPTDRASVTLDIQRQICSHQFPGVCRPEEGESYEPIKDITRATTPQKVMSLTAAGFEFIKSGGKIVDKAESACRAAICRGCALNRSTTCVCTVAFKVADALIPEGRREDGMLICGVCGCLNSVKVLMPAGVIQASEKGRDLTYPAHCWISPLVNNPIEAHENR